MFSLLTTIQVVLLLLCASSIVNGTTILPSDWGYQSGHDSGNNYGSSVAIDPYNDRFFITGTTYGTYWDDETDVITTPKRSSACFLGIYNWKSNTWTKKTFRSNHLQNHPNKMINEACHKIIVTNNGTKVLLLGYSQPHGILHDLHISSSTSFTHAKQYGLLLDINVIETDQTYVQQPPVNGNGTTSGTTGTEGQTLTITDTNIQLVGGRLLQDGAVQYPIDMTIVSSTDSTTTTDDNNNNSDNDNDIVVVSMQSYDTTENNLLQSSTSSTSDIVPYAQPRSRPQQLQPNYNEKQNFQYGSIFSLLVQRFFYDPTDTDDDESTTTTTTTSDGSSSEVKETFVDTFRILYGTEQFSKSVDVVGVLVHDDDIIVIGNTAAKGYIFGEPTTTSGVTTDLDGFITRLYEDSGQAEIDPDLVIDGSPANNNMGSASIKSNLRIESSDGQDDTITGYCHYGDDLYVVGTTKGQINYASANNDSDNNNNEFVSGEVHAFIISIDLITLRINWIRQIGGEAVTNDIVHGVSCSVSSIDNGSVLFWGGNIYNNGSLSLYDQKSNGGNDIFIIQLQTSNGHMKYIKQWGTLYDDSLTDIQTDTQGNAIVLGTTTGSFMRSKQQSNSENQQDSNTDTTTTVVETTTTDILTDIFMFTLDRDNAKVAHLEPMDHYGAGAEPVQQQQQETTTTAPVQPQPAGDTTTSTTTATTTEAAQPTPAGDRNTPTEPNAYPDETNDAKPHEGGDGQGQGFLIEDNDNDNTNASGKSDQAISLKKLILYSAILFFFLLIMIVLIYNTRGHWMSSGSNNGNSVRDIATDRQHVMKYLRDFEADDIDLKHSATGGWHCSYSNDLAEGINSRDPSAGLFPGWRRPPPTSTLGGGTGGIYPHHDPLIARDEHIDALFSDNPPPRPTINTNTTTTTGGGVEREPWMLDEQDISLDDDDDNNYDIRPPSSSYSSSYRDNVSPSNNNNNKERWGTDII